MTRFRYSLRDRKTGKIFERDQVVDAINKTQARVLLAKMWERDVPRQARNFGFVPFRDCQIIWTGDPT